MKKLIIASNNSKKIKEIKEVLKGINLDIKSLKDEGIDIDVVEDGTTFKENAFKKANEIKNYLLKKGEEDFIVMADDSGLEVDYLNGEPGVYSARYAGEHGNDSLNNEKLLKNLEEVEEEKRGAKFVCHLTLINSEGKEIDIRGEVSGRIIEELKGNSGFGYDPIFYSYDLQKTFGEASSQEKNSISHRGVALNELKYKISEIL